MVEKLVPAVEVAFAIPAVAVAFQVVGSAVEVEFDIVAFQVAFSWSHTSSLAMHWYFPLCSSCKKYNFLLTIEYV